MSDNANPAPLRILFVIRALVRGGAERQLVTLAKALSARGHEVAIVVFYGGGPLETDLADSGVAVHALGKRGRWDVLAFFLRLARLVRAVNPEILHSYLPTSNILTAILGVFIRGPRVVWGVRASDMDISRYDWLWRNRFRVEAWLSHFPDLIIVNSRVGRDCAVARDFPRDRLAVVPNGIDTGRFRPDAEARRRLRAEWGVRDHMTLIGIVGRLDPMKGHPVFIDAAARIAAARSETRFVCIGSGPEGYRAGLRESADRLGLVDRMAWLEAQADMPAVLNALDVLCSSSIYGEGFSNVIAEAMACGTTCVVTRVGDSAEIVGGTGIACASGDVEALADALLRALDLTAEERRVIGETARQRVVERFGIDALAERTIDALRGVRASGAAGR